MLKWFRLYNKYILAVGASLLMVAFLIQGTVSMFGQGRDFEIGTLDGEELMISDQHAAGREVALIAAVFNAVRPGLGNIAVPEPRTWMLMLHEARQIGLSAGDNEVAALLTGLQFDSDAKVLELQRTLGVNEDALYFTLAQWLTVEQYKELVRGEAHVPPIDRINSYVTIFNQMDQLRNMPPFYQQMLLQQISVALDSASQGRPRISRPVILRMLSDIQSRAEIVALPIAADPAKIDAEPTDADLQELFDQYKDNLPEDGKPYGFGYRFPDRVKIEFLAFPFDRVQAAVRVDEADAVAYYDKNQSEFVEQPPTPKTKEGEAEAPKPEPRQKSYSEVRDDIHRRLRRQQAEELMQKIARTAMSLLQDNLRNVPVEGGYRQFPEGFTPVSLNEIAEQIQKQFNVLPDVVREDSRWLDRKTLLALPGIGTTSLDDGPGGTGFVEYVMSVRELGVSEDNPLISHRLQVNVPGAPMKDFSNSQYLFRVIDAAEARTPEAMDEVRDQIVLDARRLAAYRKLLNDEEALRIKLLATPLEDLAKAFDVTVIKPQPFARRSPSQSGELTAPTLTDIGQDAEFVDRVFDLAYHAGAAGDVAEAPLTERVDVVPSDRNLTVYLVRLDGYQRQPKSEYEKAVASAELASGLNGIIMGDKRTDPFTYEALVRRTGFKEAE